MLMLKLMHAGHLRGVERFTSGQCETVGTELVFQCDMGRVSKSNTGRPVFEPECRGALDGLRLDSLTVLRFVLLFNEF